jgi:hypothetical protein
MNENAKAWVEALKSGEFEQNTGSLCSNEAYCCLGVATELYRRATGNGSWYPSRQGIMRFTTDEAAHGFQLLPEVKDWLGLYSEIGDYMLTLTQPGRASGTNLAEANDVLRLTFKQIADIIESEPPGLFKGN